VGWRDILPLEGVRGVIKRSGVYVHGCLPPMSKIDAKGTLGGPVTEGNELPFSWERTANKGLACVYACKKIARNAKCCTPIK
jgi:hypothetical protein